VVVAAVATSPRHGPKSRRRPQLRPGRDDLAGMYRSDDLRLKHLSDEGGDYVEVDYSEWTTYRFRPGPDGAFIDVYIDFSRLPDEEDDGDEEDRVREYWTSRIRVQGNLDPASMDRYVREWLVANGHRYGGDTPLWGEPYHSALYWND
jgi:hypothetical protein